MHCLKEKITGSKIGMVVAVLVVLAVLPFIFKLVTGTVGGFLGWRSHWQRYLWCWD